MSRRAIKNKPKEEPPIEKVKEPLTLVEFPAPPETPSLDEADEEINQLSVNYDSIALAQFERGSLLRIFRREFRRYAHYLMSDRGGKLSLEDACHSASVRYDTKGAVELMEELLNTSVESVNFNRLKDLWECSPEEAERYFGLVKMEAQREFASGHMAAEVFEPVDWMSSVWQRARFIAIRDTFTFEYKPDGGIEHALIDTLTQAYFMQQYWTETAVKRTRSDPRRESYEFAEWKHYKREIAKDRKFDRGWWDIPLISEDRAVMTTTNMVDQFSRLFQRTLRQLNNHRLAKLKAQKLEAEIRKLSGKGTEETE
jgi:hypothetical protein